MSLVMQDTQTEDIMVLFCADVINEIPLHVLATETLQFTYDTYIQQTWNLSPEIWHHVPDKSSSMFWGLTIPSSSQSISPGAWSSRPLKMTETLSYKTSETTYPVTHPYIPEVRITQPQCCENLKTCILSRCQWKTLRYKQTLDH